MNIKSSPIMGMTVMDENALLKMITVLITESCSQTLNNDFMFEYANNRFNTLYAENLNGDKKFVPLTEIIDFYMTPKFNRKTRTMIYPSSTREEKIEKWFSLNISKKNDISAFVRKCRPQHKTPSIPKIKINVYPNHKDEFEIKLTLPDERILYFYPNKLSIEFKRKLVAESVKRGLWGPLWYF